MRPPPGCQRGTQLLAQVEGIRLEQELAPVLVEAQEHHRLSGTYSGQGKVQAQQRLAGAAAADHDRGRGAGQPTAKERIERGQVKGGGFCISPQKT